MSSVLFEQVPIHPDKPDVPFPHLAEDAYDAELIAIAHTKNTLIRRMGWALQIVSMLFLALFVWGLRHDLRYAFSSRVPVELNLSSAPNLSNTLQNASHRWVHLEGVPQTVGAIDFQRPFHSTRYRLAPLVDTPNVFVEFALPQTHDLSRMIPPTSFQGRLVPINEAGIRLHNANQLLRPSTTPLEKTYILQQGVVPSWLAPELWIVSIACVLVFAQFMFGRALLKTNRSEGTHFMRSDH